jgi:hypothetical protein
MRADGRRPEQNKDLSGPRGQLLVLLRTGLTTSRSRAADAVQGFREGLKLCEEPPDPSAGEVWRRHGNFT